ncbi:hypothetical protein QRD02_07700 [Aequorivita sp. SDUM287046]|uniref:DUF4468 domain-containing protein n=1 Tax=Aequorivita aurantiaca TaxID=3053356 RepID=A0ABT8DG87_9FLAO|nr:hypothetical protein [Aequorivita aurantiaca]MDN3724263.1 hypothetical protein [Aequorivita aurantiaca]
MNRTKSINLIMVFLFMLLAFNAQSQYGVIEMNNSQQLDMATDDLIVEKDSLRYFKEKWKRKTSIMGFGAGKLNQEYKDKSDLVSIKDIKKIHISGKLMVGNKLIYNYVGIKYIKDKKRYEKYYIVEDGECQLLVKSGDGNDIFSIFVQTGDEEPFELHRSGTGTGPKYERKSKDYFAACTPAMEFINKKGFERSDLPEVVEIYNTSCID